MAMDKQDMKDKIKAAHFARTGNTMSEGDFNALIDICQGIIEEIIANAVVEISGVESGPDTVQGSVIS